VQCLKLRACDEPHLIGREGREASDPLPCLLSPPGEVSRSSLHPHTCSPALPLFWKSGSGSLLTLVGLLDSTRLASNYRSCWLSERPGFHQLPAPRTTGGSIWKDGCHTPGFHVQKPLSAYQMGVKLPAQESRQFWM
jgi:hypothetical protein